MRESVAGMRRSLEAVKDIYKSAKYAGIGCGIKSTGIGNGTIDSGHAAIRVLEGGRLDVLTGYTEMGQGLFTTIRQAVCEETGLPPEIMDVRWDKALGAKCGETWASRATTLSCAAAQRAAIQLADDLKHSTLEQLVGREYTGDYVCNFTTRPGTPEALTNPTTHMTFSYATQVVILNDDGRIERVVAAHDVGRAINPKGCAGQIEGGVHMGLGYALSENFTSTNATPDSLLLRDCGILKAKDTPKIDVILIEVPDEVGGYGAKGAGEIGLVPTAGAVAGALHSYDGIRRFSLPMDDAPAAAPSVPKSRRKKRRCSLERLKPVKPRRVIHQNLFAHSRIRRPNRKQVQHAAVVDLIERRHFRQRMAGSALPAWGCGQSLPQMMRSALAAISACASGFTSA